MADLEAVAPAGEPTTSENNEIAINGSLVSDEPRMVQMDVQVLD